MNTNLPTNTIPLLKVTILSSENEESTYIGKGVLRLNHDSKYDPLKHKNHTCGKAPTGENCWIGISLRIINE